MASPSSRRSRTPCSGRGGLGTHETSRSAPTRGCHGASSAGPVASVSRRSMTQSPGTARRRSSTRNKVVGCAGLTLLPTTQASAPAAAGTSRSRRPGVGTRAFRIATPRRRIRPHPAVTTSGGCATARRSTLRRYSCGPMRRSHSRRSARPCDRLRATGQPGEHGARAERPTADTETAGPCLTSGCWKPGCDSARSG